MAKHTPIRFQYDAEVALREVEQLRAIEELAFRRVLNLIVVCRNKVIDDDAEMGRMTKTGDAWPEIKARLVKDHGLLYIEDGYIKNTRYDAICTAVERSIHQKRVAGRASAAKRQEKKNTALPQPAVPVETAPQQVSPDPPPTDVAPPYPEPPATHVEPSRVDDAAPPAEPERAGTTIPQNWQPDPEAVAFAAARGRTVPEIERLVLGYVARHDQRGDTSTDWNAGFKIWILRALNPAGPAYQAPAGGSPSTV